MMYTTLIESEELATHLTDEHWVILDARFSLANTEQGREAFAVSRIPGAHYAHLDEHLSGELVPGTTGRHPLPERDMLADQFSAWGISNDSQIVVYDDKVGAVAARVWWLAKWLGHEKCAVLNGGFADWTSRGLAVDQTLIENSASRDKRLKRENANANANKRSYVQATTDAPHRDDFTSKSPLLQMIDIDQAASGQWTLIDAREAERYAGIHEPIDPVAGRIKGALNQPFIQNVDETGRFLPVDVLHKRFGSLKAQANGQPIAHYCGSGVTAAHNMLAMAHAGLEPGALYAGSFSEWITRDGGDFPIENSHV